MTPKPDGSSRLILNLKNLNEFIEVFHFKLEDSRTAQNLMHPGCFLVTLDLKDAYYIVPITKNCRKYLRFIFLGELFEFTVLPFGLNCAPYVFTKIMKPVVSYLRKLGYSSVIYLDDWLLIGKNHSDCLKNLKATQSLLKKLGFIINVTKSNIKSSKSCKYLGLIFNSKDMQLELPQDKRLNIIRLINKFSKKNACSIRDFASFIGTLSFCCRKMLWKKQIIFMMLK